MPIQGPFPVEFGAVFPSGAFAAGKVEMVRDFDRSTADRPVQQADKITGLPLWVVEVIDASPEARSRMVKVKIAAQYQPVLPHPWRAQVPDDQPVESRKRVDRSRPGICHAARKSDRSD
jgi:hypothetical protein